jgi:hypothetical protein
VSKRTNMRRLAPVLITLLAVLTAGNPATAQQTTTTTDPTLAALQLQQAYNDARLKIQQDQQALTVGALPASSATPNSGAYTVTGANPFPSMKLAYDQLGVIACTIAKAVPNTGPVVVYDQTEINSLVNLKALLKLLTFFAEHLDRLSTEFDRLDTKSKELQTIGKGGGEKLFVGMLAPALLEGSLKTATDIIGMFRTNTSIAYSTFSPDDIALTAAVVQGLRSGAAVPPGCGANPRVVYEPAVTPVLALDETSEFIDRLTKLSEKLAKLQDDTATDQSKIQQISDALGAFIQTWKDAQANQAAIAAEADPAKLKDLKNKQNALDLARDAARQNALDLLGAKDDPTLDMVKANNLKAPRDQFLKVLAAFASDLSAIGTSFGALQAAVLKAGDAGAPALSAILRAEKLRAKVSEPGAVILLVKTSVLGGSVVTRTNLWTGGHVYFTGGAIASYTVFNADGTVNASGIVVSDKKSDRDKF